MSKSRRAAISLSILGWLAFFPYGLIHEELSFTSAVVFTVVWGAAILAMWFFVLWLADTTKPSIEDILEQRYARGEIDEDEYRRAWETLKGFRGDDTSGRPVN